jgi:uncharacterized protein
MASDLGCTVPDLLADAEIRKRIDPTRYVTEDAGLPTLNDILSELAKPGRDPRAQFEAFRFAEGIEKIEDLEAGMKLPGIVTNLTAFGAFVDIGVHQDGLVHLSQLADRFVKDPGEILKVRQAVEVTVLSVDLERKRISLSLKKNPDRRFLREPAGTGRGRNPSRCGSNAGWQGRAGPSRTGRTEAGPAGRREKAREGAGRKSPLQQSLRRGLREEVNVRFF